MGWPRGPSAAVDVPCPLPTLAAWEGLAQQGCSPAGWPPTRWRSCSGLGGTGAIGFAYYRYAGEPAGVSAVLAAFVVAVGSGAVEATVVGLAQHWAMGPWLPALRARRWWLATLWGALAAYVLGWLPSTLLSLGTASDPAQAAGGGASPVGCAPGGSRTRSRRRRGAGLRPGPRAAPPRRARVALDPGQHARVGGGHARRLPRHGPRLPRAARVAVRARWQRPRSSSRAPSSA